MWHEQIDNIHFLQQLYEKVPSLESIRIIKMEILDEGERIDLLIDLPKKPDNPPKKWVALKFNIATLKLSCFCVSGLTLGLAEGENISSLDVTKNINYSVKASGKYNFNFVSEAIRIQEINGYTDLSKSL